MKKISSDKNTFYLKYILPILLLGIITITTATSIFYKTYLALFIPIYVLVAGVIGGRFTYYFKISDVFIDFEKKVFYVINRKKEYYFPFSDLRGVKSSSFGTMIKLKFLNNKKVLFTAPSDNLYGFGNLTLAEELKTLIIK